MSSNTQKQSTSKNTVVINHTTRILRVTFSNPRPKGSGVVYLTLMPGENLVGADWEKAVKNKTVQNWLQPGSLRNRTGGRVVDRAMLELSGSRTPKKGEAVVTAIQTAKPPVVVVEDEVEVEE